MLFLSNYFQIDYIVIKSYHLLQVKILIFLIEDLIYSHIFLQDDLVNTQEKKLLFVPNFDHISLQSLLALYHLDEKNFSSLISLLFSLSYNNTAVVISFVLSQIVSSNFLYSMNNSFLLVYQFLLLSILLYNFLSYLNLLS